jgi:aminoglycoside phosphotransferase (APT) family kinase protein
VEGYKGPATIEQFKGGQSNPTFRLTDGGGKRYVLRRKPPGTLLPSAHAVDREFKVISALYQTDVPVAKPYALCTDESVIGTMFYVMDCVEGRVFWDQSLADLPKDQRSKVYDDMNRAIAALHNVDWKGVGLGDFGKPTEYIQRQIHRWTKQYKDSETEVIPEMDNLIEWLPTNVPAGDETSVVHGDYRLDNMIFHPTEPRVLAVLDWELSTLGHPLADFSYHLMSWRLGGSDYRGLVGLDLPALGIPTEAEYVAAYCKRTRRDGIPNLDFYLAYNMFRLAGILQGIMGRYVAGTASNASALEQGKRAKPMAIAAWAQVERLLKKQG